MIVDAFSADWMQSPCDALAWCIDDSWPKTPAFQQWDRASEGWLSRLWARGEITTKPHKPTVLIAPPGVPASVVVLVGIGPRDKLAGNSHYRAAGTAIRAAITRPRATIRCMGFGESPLQQRSAVCGAMVATEGQDLFRSEKSLHPPEVLQWVGFEESQIAQGKILGAAVNRTRRWINLPPNYLYPEAFAAEAQTVAKECGLEIEVWDRSRLESERCGALLGVARGSVKEPRLIVLRYRGAADSVPPVALVGKGVTFDSGGYSIKPSDAMMGMKADMSGAATVLGILQAAAQLRAPRNLIGIVGLVENLISGDAFKLGDVLTARSGKTIEIHNTDAEGRLVLADCLNVALDHRPEKIVDFATLTGACVVALGNEIAGLMGNHEDWQQEIRSASERCGELTWPLPMFPFFTEQIASKVADIKNVGEGRYGGAITAAKFLEEFVGNCPWTHIDIAGPAFSDSVKAWCDAGATGFLVRTFAEWSMA